MTDRALSWVVLLLLAATACSKPAGQNVRLGDVAGSGPPAATGGPEPAKPAGDGSIEIVDADQDFTAAHEPASISGTNLTSGGNEIVADRLIVSTAASAWQNLPNVQVTAKGVTGLPRDAYLRITKGGRRIIVAPIGTASLSLIPGAAMTASANIFEEALKVAVCRGQLVKSRFNVLALWELGAYIAAAVRHDPAFVPNDHATAIAMCDLTERDTSKLRDDEVLSRVQTGMAAASKAGTDVRERATAGSAAAALPGVALATLSVIASAPESAAAGVAAARIAIFFSTLDLRIAAGGDTAAYVAALTQTVFNAPASAIVTRAALGAAEGAKETAAEADKGQAVGGGAAAPAQPGPVAPEPAPEPNVGPVVLNPEPEPAPTPAPEPAPGPIGPGPAGPPGAQPPSGPGTNPQPTIPEPPTPGPAPDPAPPDPPAPGPGPGGDPHTLAFTSPVLDTTADVGSTITLEWEKSSAVQLVSVNYTDNGGANTTPLAFDIAGTSTTFPVDRVQGTVLSFYVFESGAAQPASAHSAEITVHSANIIVQYPYVDDTFVAGSSLDVVWSADHYDGPVRILYDAFSQDFNTVLYEGPAPDHHHLVTLPSQATSSARIKVISTIDPSITDTMDGNFHLSAPVNGLETAQQLALTGNPTTDLGRPHISTSGSDSMVAAYVTNAPQLKAALSYFGSSGTWTDLVANSATQSSAYEVQVGVTNPNKGAIAYRSNAGWMIMTTFVVDTMQSPPVIGDSAEIQLNDSANNANGLPSFAATRSFAIGGYQMMTGRIDYRIDQNGDFLPRVTLSPNSMGSPVFCGNPAGSNARFIAAYPTVSGVSMSWFDGGATQLDDTFPSLRNEARNIACALDSATGGGILTFSDLDVATEQYIWMKRLRQEGLTGWMGATALFEGASQSLIDKPLPGINSGGTKALILAHGGSSSASTVIYQRCTLNTMTADTCDSPMNLRSGFSSTARPYGMDLAMESSGNALVVWKHITDNRPVSYHEQLLARYYNWTADTWSDDLEVTPDATALYTYSEPSVVWNDAKGRYYIVYSTNSGTGAWKLGIRPFHP